MTTRFNKVIYDLFLAWWNQNLFIKNLRENGEVKSGKKLETESRRLWGRAVVWRLEDDARSVNNMEKLCPTCCAWSSQIMCTREKNKATEQKQKV